MFSMASLQWSCIDTWMIESGNYIKGFLRKLLQVSLKTTLDFSDVCKNLISNQWEEREREREKHDS